MEHKLKNNQETACYIDILKRMLVTIDENISGVDVFFLINGYRIVHNNWLGYDYEKELSHFSFIQKVDKNHDGVKEFIYQEDAYGIIAFVDSRVLIYNEIYQKNNGKIHCVRIIDSSQENLKIEDTHIRVNDKIVKSQIAELSWKQFKDVEAVMYVVNMQRMYEEYMTFRATQYVDELDAFFNSEGRGINAIENYLKEKYAFIDHISPKDMIGEMQNMYYDIKINSYIYVNKYIEEAYCKFCRIDRNDFELDYIKRVEKIIEKLIYYAIKGDSNNIKISISELLKICEKERYEFNYVYGRNDKKQSKNNSVRDIR